MRLSFLRKNPVADGSKRAVQRGIETISEASRRLPEDIKTEALLAIARKYSVAVSRLAASRLPTNHWLRSGTLTA